MLKKILLESYNPGAHFPCESLGLKLSRKLPFVGTRGGRYKTQVTAHRSLFYLYRKYPKHS